MRKETAKQSRETIEDDVQIASVDWKAPPHEVLEAIDRLLAGERLEVVMLDTGSDDYVFRLGVVGCGDE